MIEEYAPHGAGSVVGTPPPERISPKQQILIVGISVDRVAYIGIGDVVAVFSPKQIRVFLVCIVVNVSESVPAVLFTQCVQLPPGQIEHVDPFGKENIIDSVLSFQQRFFQPPEHGVEILRIEILIVRVEYLMVKAA